MTAFGRPGITPALCPPALSEKEIKTSKNILIKDSDLGIINTSDIEGIPIKKPKYLYHLLTNMGSFIMNGVRIGDYNTGIEMHLNNEENNTSDFFI